MNTTIVIQWTEDIPLAVRPYVEQLINAWEDFAYGYDIDATSEICEILKELGIEYTIEESDI
jgi:hypothetical protein